MYGLLRNVSFTTCLCRRVTKERILIVTTDRHVRQTRRSQVHLKRHLLPFYHRDRVLLPIQVQRLTNKRRPNSSRRLNNFFTASFRHQLHRNNITVRSNVPVGIRRRLSKQMFDRVINRHLHQTNMNAKVLKKVISDNVIGNTGTHHLRLNNGNLTCHTCILSLISYTVTITNIMVPNVMRRMLLHNVNIRRRRLELVTFFGTLDR